jgi:hypothetical protein
MKKIWSCKILRKFEANAYEIELLDGVGISPIFNVVDLYPYRADEADGEEDQKEFQWVRQLPVAERTQMERIIDQIVIKKTRRKKYFEYFIKWKGCPIEDASWEREADIQKHGQTV